MELHQKKTPKGNAEQLYSVIRQRIKYSASEKGTAIKFSRKDFVDYLLKNDDYNEIYAAWSASRFFHRISPAIKLVDSNKPYSFDNIKIVPKWELVSAKKENDLKSVSIPLSDIRTIFCVMLDTLGYSFEDIGGIMNINRSSSLRIINISTEDQCAIAQKLARAVPKLEKATQ